MARFPGGTWRPLPENAFQDAIVPTQIILHTAVDQPGPTRLDRYFARADVSLESHFWIPLSGEVVQMMDTEVRADANYRANMRPDGTGAISIETEDEGDPVGVPWTPAQLDAIEAVCRWASSAHGIPLTMATGTSAPGLGYHSMFGAPSDWTPSRGKTCPGSTRIQQIYDVLLPRFEEDREVTMTEAEARAKVEILYGAILGRPADSGGLNYWASRGEGMTEMGLFWAFLAASQTELRAREARLKALEIANNIRQSAASVVQTPVVDVDAITEAVTARIIERLSEGL